MADVEHSLARRPDGSRYLHTETVRVPNRWLARRLNWWRTPDGVPASPAGQRRAEADRIRAAEQAAFRSAVVAARSAGMDAAAPAARARRMLAAASPDAARVIALSRARKGQRP